MISWVCPKSVITYWWYSQLFDDLTIFIIKLTMLFLSYCIRSYKFNLKMIKNDPKWPTNVSKLVVYCSQCPQQGPRNFLSGYYVWHFIEAGNGKKITFPVERDASIDVSNWVNWHLVAYFSNIIYSFSQCTINICFLNIFNHRRSVKMVANISKAS
jgi:hypothetical protein